MSRSDTFLTSPEYAFISTVLWISRWSARVLGAHGLVGVHGHTMARLAETPGMTQGELAEKIHRDAPATSRVLDEMTKMGLIERRVSAHDRRCRRIFLTPKAKRLHAKIETSFARERSKAGIELDPADVEALWRVANTLQQRYRSVLDPERSRRKDS